MNQPLKKATTFPPSSLRQMDGSVELAVAQAASTQTTTRPERVTQLIAAAYEQIGGKPVTLDLVRSQSAGSREWLLQRAASAFKPDEMWFEAVCDQCGKPYDLSIDIGATTEREAEVIASIVEVETSIGMRSFHIPTGMHEEKFARQQSSDDPRKLFAALCGLDKGALVDAEQFNEHDLKLIDEALEEASPEVADEAETICPSCGEKDSARIDPLMFAFPRQAEILNDTHLIASAYGWTQDQILGLSARHRAHFADLIVRDHNHSRRARR